MPGIHKIPQLVCPCFRGSLKILIRSRCNYCAVGLQNLDGDSRRHYRDYVSKGRIVTKGILPQPLAAWIGLLGCVLLIIMSSSVWWNVRRQEGDMGGISKAWSASVYFLVCLPFPPAHGSGSSTNSEYQEGILLALWAILKAWNGNLTKVWWVPRDINPSDPEMLRDCIDNLNSASKKAAEREQDRDEPLEFLDWGANDGMNGHLARRNSGSTNIGPTERS